MSSGSISGNFSAMPMNNNGLNRLNNSPMPAGLTAMPRKAEPQEGDSFTPMPTPTDKSVFPVASTAIGGAAAGAAGFGISAAFLPKNQPTELKVKDGVKDVTITGDEVKHGDYTYTMEKADEKYKVKDIVGDVKVGDKDWNHLISDKNKPTERVHFSKFFKDSEFNQTNLKRLLEITEGEKFVVGANKNSIHVAGKNVKELLSFNVVKDKDGNRILKESDELLKLINDGSKPHIQQKYVDELKTLLMSDDIKAMDAFDKFKGLKNPEAIENLIHGAGRKWPMIAAITAGTLAVGAGIGYLVGNKKPQPQTEPPVMG